MPFDKPEPVMVTAVPPCRGPDDGLTPVTPGKYANWSAGVRSDLFPPAFTRMSVRPDPLGGLTTVICDGEVTVGIAVGPNAFVTGVKLTFCTFRKQAPVIATFVPPD